MKSPLEYEIPSKIFHKNTVDKDRCSHKPEKKDYNFNWENTSMNKKYKTN